MITRTQQLKDVGYTCRLEMVNGLPCYRVRRPDGVLAIYQASTHCSSRKAWAEAWRIASAHAEKIGEKVGLAIATDAIAEGADLNWTGLEAQDYAIMRSEGLDEASPQWGVAVAAAKKAFLREVTT